MQDNKELFDYLNINQDCKEAAALASFTAAVNKAVKQNAQTPRKQIIDNLKAAAQAKVQKRSAIKNWFSAFNIQRFAIAAAAVFVLVAAPVTVIKNVKLNNLEIYSSADEANFNSLEEELQDILNELDEEFFL